MKIPAVFKDLVYALTNLDEPSFLYWVFYGGRGTGKSENIAAALVLAMASRPNTRVVCIREIQHSISESVKATLEKWVDALELYDQFYITANTLRHKTNGSECLFIGLKNSNSPNIKSISNINITFIEEASQLSEKSWRLLVPSVTRTENPKIIIAFNPDREEDIVYKEFVSSTPPKNSYVKRVEWKDNPFFCESPLYQVMLDDKERMPKELFEHIWEGKLARNIEDSLFKKANFNPVNSSEIYTQVVIGVDPATTNTDFSNEYGIIVAAKNEKGDCRILQDYTGKYTPREFASQVVEAYYNHGVSTIIIETNQGGDFIKSALLDIDTSLHIEEVRAGTSKHSRALPLANMMEIGTLRFVDFFPKLRRQMELTTLRGYLGPKGESPDALDAAIWAIYYLMDIQERDSFYQVFKPEYFNKQLENTISGEPVGYLTQSDGIYYYLEAKGYTNGSENQIRVIRSYIGENLPENMLDFLYLPDTQNNYNFVGYKYLKENKKLEERIQGIISFFKSNRIYIEPDDYSRYKNLSGNMLLNALKQYTYDTKRDTDMLVDLFCDIMELEFNL